MQVSSSDIAEPHFVIGPVFAVERIRASMVVGLKGPDEAFTAAIKTLEERAEAIGAHAIGGLRCSFVDSNVTSTLLQAFRLTEQGIYVFAYGTAVQLHRYLQSAEQRTLDDNYRAQFSAQSPSPVAMPQAQAITTTPEEDQAATNGLRQVKYRGLDCYPLPDGKIRAKTPQGWMDFPDWDQVKRFQGM
jgi:hypothetical protein